MPLPRLAALAIQTPSALRFTTSSVAWHAIRRAIRRRELDNQPTCQCSSCGAETGQRHKRRCGAALRNCAAEMRYYNLKRHWTKRIMPHLGDEKLNRILVRDFKKVATWPFQRGDYPSWCETCDWRVNHRGTEPRYWKYVCHGACHWIVNFALRLASLAEPNHKWRIISSDKHSTVWDGFHVLFDVNFQALGVPAHECYLLAMQDGCVLPVGKELRVGYQEGRRSRVEVSQDIICEREMDKAGCRLHCHWGTIYPISPSTLAARSRHPDKKNRLLGIGLSLARTDEYHHIFVCPAGRFKEVAEILKPLDWRQVPRFLEAVKAYSRVAG
jgi:hypothetical protein